MANARQQQVTVFVETFYQNWNTKVLQNRAEYFDSVNAADLAAGLPLGTIPPNSIPTFEQLTGGSATRSTGGATSAGSVVGNDQLGQVTNVTNPPNVPIPAGGAIAPDRENLRQTAAQFAADVNALAQQTILGEQSQATVPGNVNVGRPVSKPDIAYINEQGRYAIEMTLNPVGPPPGQSQGTTPGAFRTDDGSRGSSSTETSTLLRQRIDQLYGTNRTIQSQENVLAAYENISYQLSWYIAPPSFYNRFSNYRNIPDYFLLAQSGGASGTAGSVQSAQVDAIGSVETAPADLVSNASRNPFFDLDFYIDNFEVVTRFPLAGTRMSHSNTEISFTLTEPYGISLIPRLQNAVEDVYKQAGVFTGRGARYASALYVMVIKFWGQKQDGTLERVVRRTANGTPIGAVEKYIPFVIRELRFSQGSRFVEYRIVGNPPFTFVGFGQERGVLLQRYTLTGNTVKDALVGQNTATGTAASATTTGAAGTSAAAAAEVADQGRVSTNDSGAAIVTPLYDVNQIIV